ncbi:MAG: SDR family oxidoreductase [Flavobacteriales bacterium]|nr:SDR family oxidoreductase [Flavobacteriales bacterium]
MKIILITGASSGIGMETAIALHRAGHYIVLAARNLNKLELLANRLSDRCTTYRCDVTSYASVSEVVTQIIAAHGRLDVLVNNAGVGYFDKVADGKIDEWHNMVNVNVNGVLNCIHVALPHLLESKGHVVNIASVAAHNVFVNSGVYCGTKHAVLAFSEALRLELAGKLKVTTISPGAVNTAFIDSTTNQEMLSNYKDYFQSAMPPAYVASEIARAIDTPDDMVLSEVIIRPHRPTK